MTKWILGLIFLLIIFGSIYYYFPEQRLPADARIDALVVVKGERRMYAYSDGHVIKIYKIALGRDPIGDKEFQGDKKTPEGDYKINDRNSGSGFHKNLGISYPNKTDIKEARSLGVDPGGDIKIHGLKNGFGFIGKFHRLFNWTAGCIAVTDTEIDELYRTVKTGTPITIRP